MACSTYVLGNADVVFAVGNAAFHSRTLYPYLLKCLLPMLDSLEDSDEKTRSNAAGAIGNLVRNGGELDRSIAVIDIPQRLMRMTMTEKDPTTQRIALFSLGTMAVYPMCRYRSFVVSCVQFFSFELCSLCVTLPLLSTEKR
jgi:hypothetical protein